MYFNQADSEIVLRAVMADALDLLESQKLDCNILIDAGPDYVTLTAMLSGQQVRSVNLGNQYNSGEMVYSVAMFISYLEDDLQAAC